MLRETHTLKSITRHLLLLLFRGKLNFNLLLQRLYIFSSVGTAAVRSIHGVLLLPLLKYVKHKIYSK